MMNSMLTSRTKNAVTVEEVYTRSINRLFKENDFAELSANQIFEHDVNFMIENNEDYSLGESKASIESGLTIVSPQEFVDTFNSYDAEEIKDNFLDIHAFIITENEDKYYAIPIIVITPYDGVMYPVIGSIGKAQRSFYISEDLWNAIGMANNAEQILMKIFSEYMHPGEKVIGMSEYGDLSHIYR